MRRKEWEQCHQEIEAQQETKDEDEKEPEAAESFEPVVSCRKIAIDAIAGCRDTSS